MSDIRLEHFDSRHQLAEAEQAAIAAESPKYNIAHIDADDECRCEDCVSLDDLMEFTSRPEFRASDSWGVYKAWWEEALKPLSDALSDALKARSPAVGSVTGPVTNDEGAPWPTEEVKPSAVRIGDIVKQGEKMPWVTVIEIHEVDESRPDWERKLGDRLFVCEPLDDDGHRRALVAYDDHDQHLMVRRRVS